MTSVTSERQIWEAAVMLVRCHGEEAASVAGREASRHAGCDDLGYVVWSWIARVTSELIKPTPDRSESIH